MIEWVLRIFIIITFVDVLMSWVPELRRQPWAEQLHKIASIPQKPIRDLFPRDIPLDPSPMIVIAICQILIYIL